MCCLPKTCCLSEYNVAHSLMFQNTTFVFCLRYLLFQIVRISDGYLFLMRAIVYLSCTYLFITFYITTLIIYNPDNVWANN